MNNMLLDCGFFAWITLSFVYDTKCTGPETIAATSMNFSFLSLMNSTSTIFIESTRSSTRWSNTSTLDARTHSSSESVSLLPTPSPTNKTTTNISDSHVLAESNGTHENPLMSAIIALGVVIYVISALAVVYKLSGHSLHNFLMRCKPVTNQNMDLDPVINYNNATPEDESEIYEIYDEIAEKSEDTQDGVHLEDGYDVISRPSTDYEALHVEDGCNNISRLSTVYEDLLHWEDGYNVISRLPTDFEEALHVEDEYNTISNEIASSSLCEGFVPNRPIGANSLGNVNCTVEAMLDISLQLDSKPDTDNENDYLKNSSLGSVKSENLDPVHIGNTTQPPALSSDYLYPVIVFSGALDDETSEDHPPALSPDYLRPVFVFTTALDEETNEDQPPALSPDSCYHGPYYLHPVFISSEAMGEETNNDHPNNDELAESENCQAELSDTIL